MKSIISFLKLKPSVFYLSSSWEKCIAFSRCVFSGCGWGDYETIFWISPGCGIPVFFTHSFDNDFIFFPFKLTSTILNGQVGKIHCICVSFFPHFLLY